MLKMDSNHSFLWSEFENQTKTVFHNLISDTDFLDVTLVTDDEKQIKAHKVILSSISSFFRKILSSNQDNQWIKNVKIYTFNQCVQ